MPSKVIRSLARLQGGLQEAALFPPIPHLHGMPDYFPLTGKERIVDLSHP